MNWYLQYLPGDIWDYDEAGTTILVDGPLEGQPRKLVTHAARNGFIDAALIERFQASVTPGSSALCIVAENTDREALARTLGSGLRHATLLETTLTADDEARVRALLADAEQP